MKNFFAFLVLVFLMLMQRGVWGLSIWFREFPQTPAIQEIGFSFVSKDEAEGLIKPRQKIKLKLTVNNKASSDVYVYAKLNTSGDVVMPSSWSRLNDDEDIYYYGADNVLEAVSSDVAVFDDVVSNLSQPCEASAKIFLVPADEVESPAMADEIFFTRKEFDNDR